MPDSACIADLFHTTHRRTTMKTKFYVLLAASVLALSACNKAQTDQAANDAAAAADQAAAAADSAANAAGDAAIPGPAVASSYSVLPVPN